MVKPRCEFHFCYSISFFFIWCIISYEKMLVSWPSSELCNSSSTANGTEDHVCHLVVVNSIWISEISSFFFVPGLCSRIGRALWISILFYLFWICSHINCIFYISPPLLPCSLVLNSPLFFLHVLLCFLLCSQSILSRSGTGERIHCGSSWFPCCCALILVNWAIRSLDSRN